MAIHRTDVRERILDAAQELFYRDGIHATGIDAVIRAADVAKMSLYHHFPSKDHLIAAVLQRQADQVDRWLAGVAADEQTPVRARILSVFESTASRTACNSYFGCPFINAAAEFSNTSHPVRAVVGSYMCMLTGHFAALAEQAGARDPDLLAKELVVLMQGALVTAQASGDCAAAISARSVAEALLDREQLATT